VTRESIGPLRHLNEIMGYRIAAIGLAPLLLVQAHRARRRTPRLPEPSGARSGAQGAGPELRLLILGDSAAAGVGAPTQQEALSGQLIAELSPGFGVRWTLLAQTGHRVKDLLHRLAAAAPEPFDAVLISVGVNDVTGHTRSDIWIDRLVELITQIKLKFGARHIVFTGLPPMHVFPALPQPLRWYLGKRARHLDALLRNVVQSDHRCELLSMNFPLAPQFIATDGFHPGPAAYSLWGRHAGAAIRQRAGEYLRTPSART
jgi:lysophospholipase L1-like esterase